MAQQQKKMKGGRKLRRGTKQRAKTPYQKIRTAKNKHAAAARRTRRKEYWKSPEGQARKVEKEKARKTIKKFDLTKPARSTPERVSTGHTPDIADTLTVPVLKMDEGTITGSKAYDVYLSGWENEGGLTV